MKKEYASQVCHLHMLRAFFEDLGAWKQLRAECGKPSDLDTQAYDDLFKGTDADIYIPLWASACKEAISCSMTRH